MKSGVFQEDILEKIKAGDDENMKHINELKEIAEGNVYQRQSFEVQKIRTNKLNN